MSLGLVTSKLDGILKVENPSTYGMDIAYAELFIQLNMVHVSNPISCALLRARAVGMVFSYGCLSFCTLSCVAQHM